MSKIELQEQMFKHVDLCNQSGLSRRAFCQANGIDEGQFYYWARKYRKQLNPNGGFIEIKTRSNSKQSSIIEVIFPNGVRIATDSSASRNDLNKIISCW